MPVRLCLANLPKRAFPGRCADRFSELDTKLQNA
jgi:hypothetical protein